MGVVLGPNRYGKAEVRLVHVDRSTPRHVITDLTVSTHLTGDFTATHLTGANDAVVATDTQKNTVYALARTGGVGAVEEFALRLARYFVDSFDQVTGARIEIEQHGWDRIAASGGATAAGGRTPHDHAFVRSGTETRTVVVTAREDAASVISGLGDLVVLKSTGSEFRGFPDVAYTSLVETSDRILATEVTARWRHADPGDPGDPGTGGRRWDDAHAEVRATMLDTFANTHSYSLQQTLYAMGTAVLEARPEIAEIRFSMPNKHHFLVDLAPFGLDNPHEVWFAADRPYGLIEATVARDDLPPDEAAWADIAGFC